MFDRRVIIATLLSAIFGPGVGQLYNKKLRKGLSLIVVGIGLLTFVTFKLFKAVMNRAPELTSIEKAPEILNQIKPISRMELWLMRPAGIALLILWAYGIVDAYIDASKSIPTKGQDL